MAVYVRANRSKKLHIADPVYPACCAVPICGRVRSTRYLPTNDAPPYMLRDTGRVCVLHGAVG